MVMKNSKDRGRFSVLRHGGICDIIKMVMRYAKQIINKISGCKNATEFQSLTNTLKEEKVNMILYKKE